LLKFNNKFIEIAIIGLVGIVYRIDQRYSGFEPVEFSFGSFLGCFGLLDGC
jgi:hypothetical protein